MSIINNYTKESIIEESPLATKPFDLQHTLDIIASTFMHGKKDIAAYVQELIDHNCAFGPHTEIEKIKIMNKQLESIDLPTGSFESLIDAVFSERCIPARNSTMQQILLIALTQRFYDLGGNNFKLPEHLYEDFENGFPAHIQCNEERPGKFNGFGAAGFHSYNVHVEIAEDAPISSYVGHTATNSTFIFHGEIPQNSFWMASDCMIYATQEKWLKRVSRWSEYKCKYFLMNPNGSPKQIEF